MHMTLATPREMNWIELGLLMVFLVAIALEIFWFVTVRKRRYMWRELSTSLIIQAMQLPVRLIWPVLMAPVAWHIWNHRLMTIPLNTVWGLVLLVLAEELAHYWGHRAGHSVRWMWASHMVHHSVETMHLASALRVGLIENVSGNWLFRLPLMLFGFNPLAVAAIGTISLFIQLWTHTELVGHLGCLEWVLNTPSHHRVHHAKNGEYLNRNFGGMLIIWDRVFGTFAREKPETPIAYGLVQPIGGTGPVKLFLHEWIAMIRDVVRARSWRERLNLVFGQP